MAILLFSFFFNVNTVTSWVSKSGHRALRSAIALLKNGEANPHYKLQILARQIRLTHLDY
jgi:hypothetical protein